MIWCKQESELCRFCGGHKIVEVQNGQGAGGLTVVYAYTIFQHHELVGRVVCEDCGIQYAPESIGCRPL